MTEKNQVSSVLSLELDQALPSPLTHLLNALRAADIRLNESAAAKILVNLAYEPTAYFTKSSLGNFPDGDVLDAALLLLPPPTDFCLASETRTGLLFAVSVAGALSVTRCPFQNGPDQAAAHHREWIEQMIRPQSDVEIARTPVISRRASVHQPSTDICSDLQSRWRGALERVVLPGIRDRHPRKDLAAKRIIKRWCAQFVPNLIGVLEGVEFCEFVVQELKAFAKSKSVHREIRAIDLDMIAMHTTFNRDRTMPRYVPSLRDESLFRAADHVLARLAMNPS
jgi:hypothetical protein